MWLEYRSQLFFSSYITLINHCTHTCATYLHIYIRECFWFFRWTTHVALQYYPSVKPQKVTKFSFNCVITVYLMTGSCSRRRGTFCSDSWRRRRASPPTFTPSWRGAAPTHSSSVHLFCGSPLCRFSRVSSLLHLQPVCQLSDGVVQQQPRLSGLQSGLPGVQPRLPQLHQFQWHLRPPAVREARGGRRAARPAPTLPAATRDRVQRLLHVHSRPPDPEQNQTLPRHPAVPGLPLLPLLALVPVSAQLSHGHTLPLCPSGLSSHPDDGRIHGAGGPRPAWGAAGPVATPVTHRHIELRGGGQLRRLASTGKQESQRQPGPGGFHLHRQVKETCSSSQRIRTTWWLTGCVFLFRSDSEGEQRQQKWQEGQESLCRRVWGCSGHRQRRVRGLGQKVRRGPTSQCNAT